MKDLTRAKWLLEGKGCDNCTHAWSCKRNKARLLVCGEWKDENALDSSGILRVVRMAHPTTIAGNIVSVQPMSKPEEDLIYHINYTYTKTDDDKEEETKIDLPQIKPGSQIRDMLRRQEEYFEKNDKKGKKRISRRNRRIHKRPNV